MKLAKIKIVLGILALFFITSSLLVSIPEFGNCSGDYHVDVGFEFTYRVIEENTQRSYRINTIAGDVIAGEGWIKVRTQSGETSNHVDPVILSSYFETNMSIITFAAACDEIRNKTYAGIKCQSMISHSYSNYDLAIVDFDTGLWLEFIHPSSGSRWIIVSWTYTTEWIPLPSTSIPSFNLLVLLGSLTLIVIGIAIIKYRHRLIKIHS